MGNLFTKNNESESQPTVFATPVSKNTMAIQHLKQNQQETKWYEVTIPSHIKANEEFQVTVNNQVVVLKCPRGSSGGSMIRFQL